MSDVEEDELFEITDFTNASPWESFVSSIEDILHQWGLTASTYSPQSGYYPQHHKSERLSYVSHKFIISLHVSGVKKKPPAKQTDQDWPDAMVYMMDQSNDFPPKAHHHISRWFGVDQFILISADEKSESVTSESQVKLLLSTISLTLTNTGCTLPLFVQVQKKWRHMFIGLCEGCGLRTNFEMIHLKHIPAPFNHLTGLTELFRSKLCSLPAKAPSINIAARLTYYIRHWNIDDWPLEPFADNEVMSLSVGASSDPIQELHLCAIWPHLTEETIIDNATSSGFDPFNAPTWSITVRLVDSPGLLLSESLMGFLKTCYRSDTFTSLLGNKLIQEDIHNPAIGGSDFSHALTKITSNSSLSSPISLSSVMYSTGKRLEFGSEFEPIASSEQDAILEYLFPDSVSNSNSSFKKEEPLIQDDKLIRKLKSAPPNSLTARLGVAFCNIVSDHGLKAMGHIWYEVIQELRYRWESGILIPSLGTGSPDMLCCLLHQKLQMLNSCISHKISHTAKLHSNPSANQNKTPATDYHSPTSSLSFSQRVARQSSHDVLEEEGREEKGERIKTGEGTIRSTSSESDDEFFEAQETLEKPSKTSEKLTETSIYLTPNSKLQTDISYIPDSPSVIPRKLDLEPVASDPLSLAANEDDDDLCISVSNISLGKEKEERGEVKRERIGEIGPFKDLTLLETGEQLYEPETQEHTPLTEDMLWEQQTVLSKLGTTEEAAHVRAKMQSLSLLSDMQAFKAANPGCILEDFIRWYSPRDWSETKLSDEEEKREGGEEDIFHSSDGWELDEDEKINNKGYLSIRMRQPGNMWAENWDNATPIPAYKQKRLFDDTKEAEKVLHWLSALKPSELILMLMSSLIHSAILSVQDKLGDILLPSAWGYLNDAISIASNIQKVSLDSLPLYQECIGLLEKTEHDIATATSLQLKLKQGLEMNRHNTKPITNTHNKELLTSIQILVEEPELVLQDPLTSITGLSFQGLLKAQFALQSLDDLSLSPRGSSHYTTHNKGTTTSSSSLSIPTPTVREFILRTVSCEPSPYSCPSPQRMYSYLAKDELRIASSFTQDTLLLS